MFRLKHISIMTIALLFVGSIGMAQVKKNQSRLELGRNVKQATLSSKSLSPVLLTKEIPKEIKLNSKTALNQYYKSKLINPTTKKSTVALAYYTEASDNGFKNDKISVANIYPNPANDFAILEYKFLSNVKSASVNIYNVLGNEIVQLPLDKQDESIKISTRNWDNGVYLYQVVLDNKKVLTKKLIVRHN